MKYNYLNLKKLADDLMACERYGTLPDEPEGTVYIKISDTLAREIASNLLTIAQDLHNLKENILVVPITTPRYDDVYRGGIEALDNYDNI